MSLEKAKADLDKKGFLDHVIELADSTATVAEAAEALGVEPGMIAKTMSFLQGDAPVLILTEGTAKIDNHKYKETFHVKAKMIPFDEVEEKIGHAPGGVCPFGINDGITVLGERFKDTLSHAKYQLKGHETYVRVEAVDRYGRTAWTNPIYLEW